MAMDPLSALGLTSAILQIIDFSAKLISGAAEIYSSASGTTIAFEDSDRTIESLRNLTRRLDVRTSGGPLSREDRRLLEIKDGCEVLSRDVQAIISAIRPKNPGSRRESLLASWKTMRRKGKLKTLEERLDRHRAQVQEYLMAAMRCSTIPETLEDRHPLLISKTSDDISHTNRFLEALTQEQAQYSQTTRSEIRQMKTDITAAIEEAEARQSENSTSMPPDPSQLLSTIQTSLSKLVQASRALTQEDAVLQRLWFPELGSRERTIEWPHEQTFRWLLYDSGPHSPDSRDLGGKGQLAEQVTQGVPSSGRVSFSDQSADSVNDNDATSFRTAPEEEGNGVSDAFMDSGANSQPPIAQSNDDRRVLSKFEQSCTAWRRERERRNQKRESFLEWLRTEEGIFYCSGKAGSGKSTLMKFLASDGRTRDELSFWSTSKGKTLILVSFFFWNSGTPLQRSLEGLYRGILWEILRQCPSLIPVVFPTTWSSPSTTKPYVTPQPLTMDELESAMGILFSSEAVTSSHRLCLFLDGLDEYEGDYWKFARAIGRWAASSEDVKFCLSSRPYGAFMRHFAVDEARHLKLHELTRNDMYSSVADQLRQDERYTEIEDDIGRKIDLLTAVVDRADGVFLWVRLVTEELLRGMGDNCSIRQLIDKLESIPVGLESIFQRMLDSIDRTDQQRAAEMFLIMTVDGAEIGRKLFIQSIMDDLADDPRLADSLLSGNVGPYLGPADCIAKCHTASCRAIARCKGLVEVTHVADQFPRCHQLNFMHRTVGDFFKQAEVQTRLRSAVGDLCFQRRLCHALLGCFKFISPNQSLECPDYEPHRRLCSGSVKSSTDRNSESLGDKANPDPFDLMEAFLDLIRDADSAGMSPMAEEVDSLISMFRQTAEQSHSPTCYFPRPFFFLGAEPIWDWEAIPTRNLQSAIVSHSICCTGMKQTVLELLPRHTDLLVLSPGSDHVFLSAALRDLHDSFILGQGISRTPMLIERASPSINADCSERCKIKEMDAFDLEDRKTLGSRFSTWGAFLLALSQLVRLERPGERRSITGVSALLELFLRHGAHPLVIFVGYRFTPQSDEGVVTRPQGPLYMDLLSMMNLWRIVPTELTRSIINAAAQEERGGWFSRSLGVFPWVGRHTQDPFEKMAPFDNSIGGDFIPLSIIPRENLASVSWEALHETADWISGRSWNVDFVLEV